MPFERFTVDEVETFERDGYLRLPQAIDPELTLACRDWMCRELGIDIGEPESWPPGPVHRIMGSRDPLFFEAMNQPALYAAYDQLVGEGRWQKPVYGTGTFPVRFPSKSDPGDAGWHVDGSFEKDDTYHVTPTSRDRALLVLMLFSDVTNMDAPTRIRRGSHLLVPGAFREGEESLPFAAVVPRLEALAELPIDHAVGQAGDVYLCHPFLVHAATFPHRGRTPRFLAQPGLRPVEQLCVDRPDGDYSPVERALRQGLALAGADRLNRRH